MPMPQRKITNKEEFIKAITKEKERREKEKYKQKYIEKYSKKKEG